jgi:guanine deaminase
MNEAIFALKGDVIFSPEPGEMELHCDSYLVCQSGRVGGVYHRLPQWFSDIPVLDYSGRIIIPGMTDLHLHAAQYGFRGYGMDMELLDWLEVFAFPEEACFESSEYAEKLYGLFADDLLKTATTRACIFALFIRTLPCGLWSCWEQKGLPPLLAKLTWTRNSPFIIPIYRRKVLAEKLRWLEAARSSDFQSPSFPRGSSQCYRRTYESLGKLRGERALPVHSHTFRKSF